MKSNNKTTVIVAVTLSFCIIMGIVDGILKADYFTKSLVKLGVFLVCPIIYSLFDKELDIKPLFKPNKNGITLSLFLCIPVYTVILGGYLLLKDVFDFSAITGALTSNIGVSGDNFVFVSLYISFINSLLEEFFFRGFLFTNLAKHSTSRLAYCFSALAFAGYHVAMMLGWFSPVPFVLVMAGLSIGGMLFNYLNARTGTLYTSWLVHMFANFAINTIGFLLLN